MMDKNTRVICNCGETLEPVLTEEFNYKDVIECDCGRKFVIVDISGE